jgi:23S rRNA (pseudouridine1915-N3)-methyltransferase
MKLRFVWVGKTKEPAIRDLVERYLQRVARFAPVEVTEIRDRSDVGSDPKKIIETEGTDILDRLRDESCLVVLDERGREFDSVQLAEFIEQHAVNGTRTVAFVLGGHGGLSEAVKKRANLVLALSRMTLTHELARVLLLEQVYRAFSIIRGIPYQK